MIKRLSPNCELRKCIRLKRAGYRVSEIAKECGITVRQVIEHLHNGGLIRTELIEAQEARAKVIEAEAELPKAMAEAFRTGNLGIMDYNRLKNIQADTDMRDSIAGSGKDQPKPQQ
jgi:predicted transcriptional regulator